MKQKLEMQVSIKTIDKSYDVDTDTMYVSFGTGEPSYVEDINGVLLVEKGIFSHSPTGFRILNFKEHQTFVSIKEIKTKLKAIRKIDTKQVIKCVNEREEALEQAVNNTLQPLSC